jgi:hypothetical protein
MLSRLEGRIVRVTDRSSMAVEFTSDPGADAGAVGELVEGGRERDKQDERQRRPVYPQALGRISTGWPLGRCGLRPLAEM